MIYKFVVAVCFIFPFIGIVLMERGAYGLSINETGHRNFASEAFLAYTLLTFVTIFFAHRLRIFDRLGTGCSHALARPNGMTFRALVALIPMLAFVLISLGGLATLLGIVSAGEFRAALGGGGALGYLIIKYYAPAVFACILMSNTAWNPPGSIPYNLFCSASAWLRLQCRSDTNPQSLLPYCRLPSSTSGRARLGFSCPSV